MFKTPAETVSPFIKKEKTVEVTEKTVKAILDALVETERRLENLVELERRLENLEIFKDYDVEDLVNDRMFEIENEITNSLESKVEDSVQSELSYAGLEDIEGMKCALNSLSDADERIEKIERFMVNMKGLLEDF